MEQSSKNADISILSNFLTLFSDFFSISRNFTKYYLHAKFQINWTIQTEITEGGRICPPPPQPYQSAKSPVCLGLTPALSSTTMIETNPKCKKKAACLENPSIANVKVFRGVSVLIPSSTFVCCTSCMLLLVSFLLTRCNCSFFSSYVIRYRQTSTYVLKILLRSCFVAALKVFMSARSALELGSLIRTTVSVRVGSSLYSTGYGMQNKEFPSACAAHILYRVWISSIKR